MMFLVSNHLCQYLKNKQFLQNVVKLTYIDCKIIIRYSQILKLTTLHQFKDIY